MKRLGAVASQISLRSCPARIVKFVLRRRGVRQKCLRSCIINLGRCMRGLPHSQLHDDDVSCADAGGRHASDGVPAAAGQFDGAGPECAVHGQPGSGRRGRQSRPSSAAPAPTAGAGAGAFPRPHIPEISDQKSNVFSVSISSKARSVLSAIHLCFSLVAPCVHLFQKSLPSRGARCLL